MASHAGHDHPNTPAARKQCRAGQAIPTGTGRFSKKAIDQKLEQVTDALETTGRHQSGRHPYLQLVRSPGPDGQPLSLAGVECCTCPPNSERGFHLSPDTSLWVHIVCERPTRAWLSAVINSPHPAAQAYQEKLKILRETP